MASASPFPNDQQSADYREYLPQLERSPHPKGIIAIDLVRWQP